MAYAKLASLNPANGLYSSFIGVFTYCFFATSKDITIGMINKVVIFAKKKFGSR